MKNPPVRTCTVRQHVLAPATAKSKALDRVKLSLQHGPLGGFDRADGELLAALWNAYHAGLIVCPTLDLWLEKINDPSCAS